MSYMSAHNMLRRARGRAGEHTCKCGKPARDWAYSNASTDELVDELGRRYSRNFDDYTPMCKKCHMEFDMALKTHCPQGHPYEGENVLMDGGNRKCKACVYAKNRGYKLSREQRDRANQLQNERRRKLREARSDNTTDPVSC